jgi:beta-glucanase (GH16 family)
VKARLAFAALAVMAILGLVGWGLAGNAQTDASPHASGPAGASPSAAPSASASPSASAAANGAPESDMHLVFDADFGGSTLNSAIWDTCYPWANQATGCTNFDNNEVEWYLPSQVSVSGGYLDLTARKAPTLGYTREGTQKEYYCRSGMVTTHPGFNFKYGYVQVVAHISNGSDLWPALWLAASNLKWPPEIDMLEHWGPPRNISAMFFHPVGGEQASNHFPPSVDVTSGFQTFAVDWTPTKVTWYLDGKVMLSVVQEIPHQKMYFIADLAAWNYHGHRSACSGTLQIRSVKIWQR